MYYFCSFRSQKAERDTRIGFGIDFSALSANSSCTDVVGFSQEVEPLRKCHARFQCWREATRQYLYVYKMFGGSENLL